MLEFFKKNKEVAVFVAFLVIGLGLYANSFGNQFFWDDDDLIVKNSYVQNFQIGKFFTENEIAGVGQVSNYWRPLALVSFAVDYKIWGLAPIGFHLTNTFLHIFCAWLIFILLYKLIEAARNYRPNNFWLAFLPALLFLIHPLQTEAVVYVSGRADSLSAIFCLLSLIFYFNFREEKKKTNLFYSLLFFVFGLLVKEQVILLPALILLLEIVFFLKNRERKKIIESLKFFSFFLFFSAVYLVLRLTVLNFNDILGGVKNLEGDYVSSGILERIYTFFFVVLNYFSLLFAPFNLHMSREVAPVRAFFSWPVLSFLVLMALVIFICIKTWKSEKLISFGFLWFFIILLPRTNIIAINRPMYEHWLYLPMTGFWLAIFALIFLLFKIFRSTDLPRPLLVKEGSLSRIKIIFYFLVISFAIFLSALTIARNRVWRDPITFYENNLRYTPNSFIQHNNLGMAYAAAGRDKEAIAQYRRAMEIKDVYPQIHNNLANSLANLGNFSEAEAEYKKAIEMSPEFAMAYQNLYNLYVLTGRQNEAEKIRENMANFKIIK